MLDCGKVSLSARRVARAVAVTTAAGMLAAIASGCGSTGGSKPQAVHTVSEIRRIDIHPHPLTLGFATMPESLWMDRAIAEGAQVVRIAVAWSRVAPPQPPPGFNPSDPASPGYNWSAVDAAVRDLSAHGFKVLIEVLSAPTWAEGPSKPQYEPPGTWRPDAAKFAAFATAIARRYDGRYPDPEVSGTVLPRVRYWQPWNEPNLDEYLSPQWTRGPSGWVDTSPFVYRGLLNAFYAAVKGVAGSNFVVTAGTSPYGDFPQYDRPGHQRMQPVPFYRDLFCLKGATALRPTSCPDPAHLDAVDHHVYSIYGPLWHAAVRGDLAVPDTHKLAAVLRAAQRAGTVLPRGPKAQWVTEIGWASNPPDQLGVPLAKQARWYEQGMYELWRQGVDTVLVLSIADANGLYLAIGAPKPAATAYRFPFTSQRVDSNRVELWGRAPQAGMLQVQRWDAHRWTVVQTMRVRTHQVFARIASLRGAATLRARLGNETSLPWRQSG